MGVRVWASGRVAGGRARGARERVTQKKKNEQKKKKECKVADAQSRSRPAAQSRIRTGSANFSNLNRGGSKTNR